MALRVAGADAVPARTGWLRLCCRLCWSRAFGPCSQTLPKQLQETRRRRWSLPDPPVTPCCTPAALLQSPVTVQGPTPLGSRRKAGAEPGREKGWGCVDACSQIPDYFTSCSAQGNVPSTW